MQSLSPNNPALGQLKAASPAKVNLYLKVLGRRPDGYHELDTAMAKLSLADMVELSFIFSSSEKDTLKATSTGLPPLPPDFCEPNNLALKAVQAYRELTRWPQGQVNICLDKKIPLGAGLGGGSSNAATVLKILNEINPRPLSKADLSALALGLGADVPFFIKPKSLARAGGIGEVLSPIDELNHWRGRQITLINPNYLLSTASVFEILGLTNGSLNNNLMKIMSDVGANDLLKPALKLVPTLHQVVEAIKTSQPLAWGMSGSGATFWFYKPKSIPKFQLDWWREEVDII